MSEPKPSIPSARSSKEIPVAKPRWSFFKGMLTGAAIEVPILALTVWVLAQVELADPDAGLMRIMRLTTVFAGIAALFTAGGIGRLAAYASLDGGRRRAVIVAARAHAVASCGLVVIAVIPHGHVPATHLGWVVLACVGLIPGAICGAIIGFVCGSPTTSVGLAEVWSLAQRPSGALLQLLDPRDLVKLGAALRTRTTTLFEGIFDPAPAPPPDAKQPVEEPKPPPATDERKDRVQVGRAGGDDT
jgi:hypothetical protein